MQDDVVARNMNARGLPVLPSVSSSGVVAQVVDPSVAVLTTMAVANSQQQVNGMTTAQAEESPCINVPVTGPSLLNVEQRRAYDIVVSHLEQTLAGRRPPLCRMVLHGEGGTGTLAWKTNGTAVTLRHRQIQSHRIHYAGVRQQRRGASVG
jgi:hypothetical protein